MQEETRLCIRAMADVVGIYSRARWFLCVMFVIQIKMVNPKHSFPFWLIDVVKTFFEWC